MSRDRREKGKSCLSLKNESCNRKGGEGGVGTGRKNAVRENTLRRIEEDLSVVPVEEEGSGGGSFRPRGKFCGTISSNTDMEVSG